MKITKIEVVMVSLLAFSLIFFIISRFVPVLQSPAVFVQVLTFFCVTVIHGYKTLGGKNMIAFIIIAYIIPLLIEYMGTLGFFAPWFYWEYNTTTLGPLFMGKVPYLIPLTWLSFMYCAWTLANLIFNQIRLRLD